MTSLQISQSMKKSGFVKVLSNGKNSLVKALETTTRNLYAYEMQERREEDKTDQRYHNHQPIGVYSRTSFNNIAHPQKFAFEFAAATQAYHDMDARALSECLDAMDHFPLDTYSNQSTLFRSTGDDALLVSDSLIAIADGVTSWGPIPNGNASLWATLLLGNTHQQLHKRFQQPRSNLDYLIACLDNAYSVTRKKMLKANLQGSSTILISVIAGDRLHTASIGDSKIYVIRDGKIIETNKTCTSINGCPRQVGTNTKLYPSSLGFFKSSKLEPNDIIIAASDGLSDNLWPCEIEEYINWGLKEKKSLQEISDKLMYEVYESAYDNYAVTPYSQRISTSPLNKNSLVYGGKLDDTSICVARVLPILYEEEETY